MHRQPRTQRDIAHKSRKALARRHPRPPPASVLSLPFEILAYIFFFVRDTAASQLHWVRLAWVCRYWREIALESHLLWTRLSFSNLRDPGFASVLLHRAHGLDLELAFDTTASDIQRVMALFLDHLHQLRSLSITFLLDQSGAVQDLLNMPMPRLVTLAVGASYPDEAEGASESVVAQLLLDPLAVPSLRNLRITSLRLDAPQRMLSKLVSLELNRFQGDKFASVTDWIIEILENCGPTLQHLTVRYVEHWGTIWAGMPNPPQSPLPFPRLQRLTFRGTTLCYTAELFLARLRLPDTTCFDASLLWNVAHGGRRSWTSDVFSDILFPPFRSEREVALPILLKTRRLCVQAGKSFYLTGRPENADHTLWCATADLKDIPRQASNDMFPDMVSKLSELVASDAVIEYECHFAPYIPTYEPWPKIIGSFPNLRKFTFGGTRSVEELLNEFVGCRAGIRGLQELTLCVPEIAESTEKVLLECKKLKLQRGTAVIPQVVTFRLPKRLAKCRSTHTKIVQLKVKLERLIQLEVCYLDCEFCQQLPKTVPRRRSLRASR
ncbi:hypothetical protein OH77DRAFT_69103 [Trametes cingulata]|nr:hypothetical protein OH77DRAFT_69103 [Trametes cingulata]